MRRGLRSREDLTAKCPRCEEAIAREELWNHLLEHARDDYEGTTGSKSPRHANSGRFGAELARRIAGVPSSTTTGPSSKRRDAALRRSGSRGAGAADRDQAARKLSSMILRKARELDRKEFHAESSRDLERTSYHEAGHAVAALRLGDAELVGVTVDPSYRRGTLGTTTFRLARAAAETNLVITFAGSEAEDLAGFAPDPREHAQEDAKLATRLISKFWDHASPTLVENVYRGRARSLLKRDWSLVETIARDLRRFGTLTRADVAGVAEIFDAAREFARRMKHPDRRKRDDVAPEPVGAASASGVASSGANPELAVRVELQAAGATS